MNKWAGVTIKARTGNGSDSFVNEWVREIIFERALADGVPYHDFSNHGMWNEACSKVKFFALMKEIGANPLYEALSDNDEKVGGIYLTQDCRYEVKFLTSPSPYVWVNGCGLNKEELQKVQSLTGKLSPPPARSKRGSVFVLVSGPSGLQLTELGTAGEVFEPGNYREDVVEGYRHVVKDLNRKVPCGRIAILDGPPGTGKTHMVRALLNEAPEATFILVQASSVVQLGNPDFIPVLMNARRFGTLVIILEDADECLSSRSADNVAAISALLNFTDGIFGAMLDIRIVATTNVRMVDIDAAVVRPGRLCRHLHIGRHDFESAQKIYNRLIGKDESETFPNDGTSYTLGDIYTKASGNGAVIENKDEEAEDGDDDDDLHERY